MRIEVAHATPTVQRLVRLELPAGATLREALRASGLLEEFSLLPDELVVGVHGEREPNLNRPLAEHDRVEIYRPLVHEPKEARRRRAGLRNRRDSASSG